MPTLPSTGAMTVLLAGAVLLMLAVVMLGGKLTVETRRRVELALALIFYPVAAGALLWRASMQDDWVLGVGSVIFAGLVAWNGVRNVRARLNRPAESKTTS